MKELIICAAIKMPDGYIVRGHRHNDALNTARGITKYTREDVLNSEQGFVTSENRFVNREIAHDIHCNGEYGQLYSEMLY